MKSFIVFVTICVTCISSFAPAYPGGCFNPGPIPYFDPYKQCPNVNCTETSKPEYKECNDNNDCLQKEVCCNYPCDEGKTVCLPGNGEFYETRIMECLVIKNCKKWEEDHKASTICEDNGDCHRTEKCCFIPCLGQKMCQEPVEVYLNSGIPVYKPPPVRPLGGRAMP